MATEMTADDLFWERVREARAMRPEDKLTLGLELYELTREFAISGIHMQHPDADEAEVQRLLNERLEIAHRLESKSWE